MCLDYYCTVVDEHVNVIIFHFAFLMTACSPYATVHEYCDIDLIKIHCCKVSS